MPTPMIWVTAALLVAAFLPPVPRVAGFVGGGAVAGSERLGSAVCWICGAASQGVTCSAANWWGLPPVPPHCCSALSTGRCRPADELLENSCYCSLQTEDASTGWLLLLPADWSMETPPAVAASQSTLLC